MSRPKTRMSKRRPGGAIMCNFYADADTIAKLGEVAATKGITRSSLIYEAVLEKLAREAPKG
jgi:hypothetical protein